MTQERRIGPHFELRSFEDLLEAKVASMYELTYLSAEYQFSFDRKRVSNHPRHIADTFALSYLGRMWNGLSLPSQESYYVGTANFWDILDYRKLHEHTERPCAALRVHPPTQHGNLLIGQCCDDKIFLSDEEEILTVICNVLSFVKQFEAKEKSISIRNLDYFSTLSHARIRGHLIDIMKPFNAVPKVYRSPSPALQPARDRLEELVFHMKSTVTFSPI
ncbi:hypothetical protein HY772_02515 [Candidatus Woesearchaeota archaeon]|nr:hypothetical protein [Candidatus Woesearchaeota archaeon]